MEQLNTFLNLYDEEIARNMKGKAIRAKTIGQREYVRQFDREILYFVLDLLGQGKHILRLYLLFKR